MKKSLLTTLLPITLVCALSACGGGGGNSENNYPGANDPVSNSQDNGSGSNSGSVDGQTTYTVTSSVNGDGGAISPSAAISVRQGATTSFTLTPNSGYIPSIGGTCGGTLNGNTYTTRAITADCTVEATFTQTSSAIGSVAECYKMPSAVKQYEVLVTSEQGSHTEQISLAPTTFMGQAAWETTSYAPYGIAGLLYNAKITYSTAENTRHCDIAAKFMDQTFVFPAPRCISFDIKPDEIYDSPGFTFPISLPIPFISNQTLDIPKIHGTFVGFDTITVNGKVFSNACHLKYTAESPQQGVSTGESWIASEYGEVRSINTFNDGSTTFTEFSRDFWLE